MKSRLLIRVPVLLGETHGVYERKGFDGWHAWQALVRHASEHAIENHVGIALEIDSPEQFESLCGADSCLSSTDLDRWYAEPVACVIVKRRSFKTNRNGFPVLRKELQSFLKGFFQHGVAVIFEDDGECEHDEVVDVNMGLQVDVDAPAQEVNVVPSPAGTESTQADSEAAVDAEPSASAETGIAAVDSEQFCISYLGRLFSQRPTPNLKEKFGKPYRDFLQSPLQPLFDNLEAETYETFEKDPIKYVNYEDAVYRAALQRLEKVERLKEENEKKLKEQRSFNEDDASEAGAQSKASDPPKVTIVVAGAGRGPLVQSSINAVERVLKEKKLSSPESLFRIACIEKN